MPCREIDRVLSEMLTHHRPGYFDAARRCGEGKATPPAHPLLIPNLPADENQLADSEEHAEQMLRSRRRVIAAG